MAKNVVVRIPTKGKDAREGKIEVEANGFTGGECIEATKFIEQLGLVNDDEREKKPEFFMQGGSGEAQPDQIGG